MVTDCADEQWYATVGMEGRDCMTQPARVAKRTALAPTVREVRLHAEQVFGSAESARRWLERPHHLLGGEAPEQRLSDAGGRERVDEILTHIEYGVCA